MLVRIVKMTFLPEKVTAFQKAFEERKELIATFEGCSGVRLLRDINSPNTFFTYSTWDTEEHLNVYRQSTLFTETWSIVKRWFNAKPEAWSVAEVSF